MLTFTYYLLKVIICSGILYGYYLAALRNKIFHAWNRFYLLATVIISLVFPLIKISILQQPQAATTPVIHLLQVVNTGEEFVYTHSGKQGFQINTSNLYSLIYALVSVLLSVFLIQSLIKIGRLKHLYPSTLIDGIHFRNTDAKGTPFSFFNNIFWNNKIDPDTFAGRQIFQHEVTHVREKHTYDKIFLHVILIFFWCNPVFWLIRKELNLVHEFIADKKAVEDNDTAAFAAMVLQAFYPRQYFNITNHFFYSPLKRRLLMLTKNKNPKMSYLSRLLVLPLAALVFFAFTLKAKMHAPANFYSNKKITVVIDAGHGGTDKGISVNGINEKDITLSLAKEIRDINTNKNIDIVLTRAGDSSISVQQRVDLAKSAKADFYISIHLDADVLKNANSGFSVLVPKNDNAYLDQSKILASDLIESFKNYKLPVNNNLKQQKKGVLVLKANEYPAVLIEAGVLTTQKDLNYLIKQENQETIARNILNGVERYAAQITFSNDPEKVKYFVAVIEDTAPINKNIKSKLLIDAAFADTKNHIWLNADTIIFNTEPATTSVKVSNAVLVVNGKVENNSILKNQTIVTKRLVIHSGDEKEMLNTYGEAAKNGVLFLKTPA